MMASSNFHHFEQRNKSKLYVWFCSIDVPAKRFEMFKTLLSFESADILFLNCKNNSYYIEGVPSLGNFSTTISELKQLFGKYDSVTTLGNSMGAYGALLYGILLKVDHIIAYAPELQLGVLGGKYNVENKRAGYHLYNLNQLLVSKRFNGSVHIIVGEKAYFDMIGMVSFPNLPNVHFYSIPNAYHSLVGVFQHDVVDHLHSVQRDENLSIDGVGSLINHPDLIAWLYCLDQRSEADQKVLKRLIEYYYANESRFGYLNGYVALEISKVCRRLGEDSLFKSFISKAIKFNHKDIESWYILKKESPTLYRRMLKCYSMDQIKDERLMSQIFYKKYYEGLYVK